MAKAIMVQGTASNVGKSIIAAGLCRIFRRDGFSVAPFKSQNMALNSFVTRDGLEMGRAQAVQAEAAGIEPSVLMNPILLKPTGEASSRVVVLGETAGVLGAAEYQRRKPALADTVRSAYRTLADTVDVVVIEGAGSPAEINLRDNDIVNMGMAAIADAPVLLVGDIDRGGVFAGVYGTVALLEPGERERVKGVVINKFRGDLSILSPGLRQLEELTGVPVVGVVPWLAIDIDDEDSLSGRLETGSSDKPVDIAVVRLPRIADFNDFNALGRHPLLGVRYAASTRDLGNPDLLILPDSENAPADLLWLRENGLEAAIARLADSGVPVIGVGGGFQMLGERLAGAEGTEAGGLRGMGLLPVRSRVFPEKIRTRVTGRVNDLDGYFSFLSGAEFEGYEIRLGESFPSSGVATARGAVMGTYVHGLFGGPEAVLRIAGELARRKGLSCRGAGVSDAREYRERQYDALDLALRDALDMEAVYGIMGLKRRQAGRRRAE